MTSEKRITIVMPAHNESESIEKSVGRLRKSLGHLAFKLILVDDGSTDETKKVCESLLDEDTELLSYKNNRGKGHALKLGLLKSVTEFSAYIDSDLDLHPHGIVVGLLELESRKDITLVGGSKFHENSQVKYPKTRRIYSGAYRFLVWLLFRLPIKDTQVGLKVFRTADVFPLLQNVTSQGWAFDLELLARLHGDGKLIAEIPVSLDFQFNSSVGISSGFRAFVDTILIFKQLRVKRKSSRHIV